jgi:hypothetical protein
MASGEAYLAGGILFVIIVALFVQSDNESAPTTSAKAETAQANIINATPTSNDFASSTASFSTLDEPDSMFDFMANPSSSNFDIEETIINPTTGLPMMGGIGGFDAGGSTWCETDSFNEPFNNSFNDSFTGISDDDTSIFDDSSDSFSSSFDDSSSFSSDDQW